MKKTAAGRRRSRKFLIQVLYQAQLTGDDLQDVVEPFIAENDMKRADVAYFRDVLEGIGRDQESLKQSISANIDRDYKELDPVETAILLLGAYELTTRLDVPGLVVINEAVELARIFGATDSYKYVNAVLDVMAHALRRVAVNRSP